jgi:hypothetical protein
MCYRVVLIGVLSQDSYTDTDTDTAFDDITPETDERNTVWNGDEWMKLLNSE